MDSFEVAEEIIVQFDDKISGHEALEFVAFPLSDAKNDFEFLQPKNEMFKNPSIKSSYGLIRSFRWSYWPI